VSLVGDGDLAVVLDPAQTAQHVVNTRRRLHPHVLLTVPPPRSNTTSYRAAKRYALPPPPFNYADCVLEAVYRESREEQEGVISLLSCISIP